MDAPRSIRASELDADGRAVYEELACQDLGFFLAYTWEVLEPTHALEWGPHLGVFCAAVQRQMEGDPEYRRLLLVVPPGMMKSRVGSVVADAFEKLHWSSRRSLYLSTAEDLAERDSRFTRDILKSDLYQALVARLASPSREPCLVCGKRAHRRWTFAPDQDQKAAWETSQRGGRLCKGMESKVTGHRGDSINVDDPLDALALARATPERQAEMCDEAWNTIGYYRATRIKDARTSPTRLIMQRVHPSDPAGRALAEGGWKAIVLPMEFESAHPDRCAEDWRTRDGELLCPAFFGAAEVARAKATLDPGDYAAQFQQRASAKEGGLFQASWFQQFYTEDPVDMARGCDEVALSVDCTFKGGEANDRVSMQAWGRKGARFVLLDRVCERLDYPATRQALKDFAAKWPRARLKLVEGKANGPAVVADLRLVLPGLVEFDPGRASKWERAKVGSVPAFRAGNVLLPSKERCPWVTDYIAEHVSFSPRAVHDDDVDATSQLLLDWTMSPGAWVELGVREGPSSTDGGLTTFLPPRAGVQYAIGVVPGWGTTAEPGAAVVLAEDGRHVATLVVDDADDVALVDRLLDLAVQYEGARCFVLDVPWGPSLAVAKGLRSGGARVWTRDGKRLGEPRATWTMSRSDMAAGWSALREDGTVLVLSDPGVAAEIRDVLSVEGEAVAGKRPGLLALAVLAANLGRRAIPSAAPPAPTLLAARKAAWAERFDAPVQGGDRWAATR